MALRRCLHPLSRHSRALLSTNQTSLQHSLEHLHSLANPISIETLNLTSKSLSFNPIPRHFLDSHFLSRHFTSGPRDDSESEDDNDDDEEEEDDVDDGEDTATSDMKREYSTEEREAEAAAIGYKVVGPLQPSDRVFKPYEPVYAVVQIGSHQFKVSYGDCIFTERLKFCDVNDKLILNKVLLLGSRTQTMVGRPIVTDAAVHAVVEEHALDAKVIIFKKKRRKNYRRTKGHRQELTKLRITDIQGIAKPETRDNQKPKKVAVKKPEEKVAVAA